MKPHGFSAIFRVDNWALSCNPGLWQCALRLWWRGAISMSGLPGEKAGSDIQSYLLRFLDVDRVERCYIRETSAGWCFQIFLKFSSLFGEDEPIFCLIFFRWVGWNHQPVWNFGPECRANKIPRGGFWRLKWCFFFLRAMRKSHPKMHHVWYIHLHLGSFGGTLSIWDLEFVTRNNGSKSGSEIRSRVFNGDFLG